MGINNTEFKVWMLEYQPKIKREIVGKKFNNLSFHEGTIADLEWLLPKLAQAVKQFRADAAKAKNGK